MLAATPSESGSEEGETLQAPIIPLIHEPIVCVEHPCIIKNLDSGIKSLGGEYAINKVFEDETRLGVFETSLRPDDDLATTMRAKKVDVNHLVLKVVVPKRTGRRRKRGSNAPFQTDEQLQSEPHNGGTTSNLEPLLAETVVQSLKDHGETASIEMVGQIKETHRFRRLPDYQYATSTNSLMQSLRGSIMSGDAHSIEDFLLNPATKLAPGQDIGPPPFFSLVKQPFNYSYRQNIYIKTVTDADGKLTLVNTTAPIKHIRHNLDPDEPVIPLEPPAELPPLETTSLKLRQAVKSLNELFDARPLMQRRVFINLYLGKQAETELKVAAGYCGYAFTSGPYRDVLIKFGIDPRKDPKYRIYQTVSYQIQAEGKGAPDDPGSYIRKEGGKRITRKQQTLGYSHIFDGAKFYKDGKVWQVCDVTDPMLKGILENVELRSEPDMIFSGWYGNGTWALFRRLMKYKIQCLQEGKKPNDDLCRAVAANFPTFVDETNVARTRADWPDSFYSQSELADLTIEPEASAIASEVRSMAMAAYRYRNKHYQTRQHRVKGDTVMADVGTSAEDDEGGIGNGGEEEEDDAALIGFDSDGEESEEGGDEETEVE